MAKYINADEIKYRHGVTVGENLGGLRAIALQQDIDDMPPANVIGCSEYEKLCLVNLDLAETNKGLLEEHKELVELRSKIDKAIEEIRNIDPIYSVIDDRTRAFKNFDDIKTEVLEILKRNVGE